jgi:hypothetical protein
MNDGNWHYYCYIQDSMQGEKKKAKSRGSKGEKWQLGPGRPDRIDEYNFFLAQEEALEEGVPEGKAKKTKRNDRNKSMTFFLSE